MNVPGRAADDGVVADGAINRVPAPPPICPLGYALRPGAHFCCNEEGPAGARPSRSVDDRQAT
jgi:hypothetical protein